MGAHVAHTKQRRAIHCLSDDNTNTTIKDSVCFHFFELPSDLERIQRKLDADMKERLVKAAKEILSDPYSGLNLKGDLKEYWKKRVGKYRIYFYGTSPNSSPSHHRHNYRNSEKCFLDQQ